MEWNSLVVLAGILFVTVFGVMVVEISSSTRISFLGVVSVVGFSLLGLCGWEGGFVWTASGMSDWCWVGWFLNGWIGMYLLDCLSLGVWSLMDGTMLAIGGICGLLGAWIGALQGGGVGVSVRVSDVYECGVVSSATSKESVSIWGISGGWDQVLLKLVFLEAIVLGVVLVSSTMSVLPFLCLVLMGSVTLLLLSCSSPTLLRSRRGFCFISR